MITRLLSVLLLTTFILTSGLSAQTKMWEWSKQVSVSTKTDWDHSHVDDNGNFYFVGTSEKFVGNKPPRAIVISKWNADTTIQWQTRYEGGSTITKSDIGTDALGNVVSIVYFSGKLKRPDGTEMSHFLDAYALIKLDKDGKELWSKRLTVGEYKDFTVLPDGHIGMRVITGVNIEFGDSTITAPNQSEQLLLISPDGGLRAMINPMLLINPPYITLKADFQSANLVSFWTQVGNFAPVYVNRGVIDLAQKTYTAMDTLSVNIGASYDLDIKQIHTDFSNGHSYALIEVGRETTLEGDVVLQPGTSSNEAYIVEFDADLMPLNKIRVTNPLYFNVRDTQVVVTSKHPIGHGFTSDEMTIPTLGIADGHIVYVMSRDLKYRRHAIVYPRTASSTPENTMIDSKGSVYVHMESNYDLFFDQRVFVAPLSSDASIIVLAKVMGAPTASVADASVDPSAAAYPNPASSHLTFDLAGGSTYSLIDALGRTVMTGTGNGATAIDISGLAVGGYVLVVTTGEHMTTQPISIVQ